MRPGTWFGTIGALSMAMAVALGAVGAHALKARLVKTVDPQAAEATLDRWDTAVKYQMAQSGLLIAAGLFAARTGRRSVCLSIAVALGVAGAIGFSGGLYGYVLSGDKSFVGVVPIGGGLMIASWIALAVAWFTGSEKSNDEVIPPASQ